MMEEENMDSNNNNEKRLEKSKAKSYAVRATKRLFKTLSFKTQQQPAGTQQSKTSSSSDDVPSSISFAPTFDSSAADTHDTHHYEHIDDLSHMLPKNVSEMIKEQDEYAKIINEDVLSHVSSTYISDMVKQQVEYNKLLLRTEEDVGTERQTENETTTLEKDRDDDEDDVSIEENKQWWAETEIDNENEKKYSWF